MNRPDGSTVPGVRRTTRSTAGKHSNPLKLPKSVLQEACGMHIQGDDYSGFSSAINSLGQALGQTLGSILQETYLKQHRK